MEIEVPVEKNTISKHNLGFTVDDFSKNINSSQSNSFRYDSLSRSESENSQNDGNNLGIEESLMYGSSSSSRTNNNSINNASSANPTRSGTTTTAAVKAEDEFSYRLPRMMKIAVVGESTTGKTSLCENICADHPTFSEKYRLTCGVEIYAKTLKVLMKSKDAENTENTGGAGDGDNSINSSRVFATKSGDARSKKTDNEQQLIEKVNLIIMDSSGKDLYVELLPRCWGRIDGIIAVIDLTSQSALETVVPWIELAKASLSTATNGKVDPTMMRTSILIGNKSDLKEQRVITTSVAQEFAKKCGMEYFECSIKENRGIQEAFQYLGKSGLNQIAEQSTVKKNQSNKTTK